MAASGPINRPSTPGTYYEATVPDTLDLAEHARLGLGHFLAIMREDHGYEMPISIFFDKPSMLMHGNALGACQCKAAETMAFERLMTGSTEQLDEEDAMLRMLLDMFGDDGLHWVAGSPDKEWLDIPEPFVMMHGQGRILRAMVMWSQYTGDAIWNDTIERHVAGLDKIVMHKDDYAYFPVYGKYEGEYVRSCYVREGWGDTVEPTHEKFGEEGSLFNHQGHVPGGMATSYLLTGDENALRLSGELSRFLVKPKFWADWEKGDYPNVIGAEHAHWHGHWHGHLNTLRAVLDYAAITQDARLMEFVRDGYEWGRQKNIARIGYFDSQGCGTGRIIGVAVKLSLMGVGDYWEDVDQYIRNHGIEMQIRHDELDYIASLAETELDDEATSIFNSSVGGFGGQPRKHCVFLCCSPHGNIGIYYAWDGIIRYDDGVARVNLLLNRASPWMDVDSYLPYEGKVVLRNKEASEAFVRIPLWVDKSAVRARVGESNARTVWFDQYLRFEGLKPGDVLTIEFPVVETTEEWHLDDKLQTCRFRGNTLVEMSPGLPNAPTLYKDRSAKYSVNHAPMTTLQRFATPKVISW